MSNEKGGVMTGVKGGWIGRIRGALSEYVCSSIGLAVVLMTPDVSLVHASPAEFSIAREGTPLVFPRDHGAHPNYQTEWWYYTGQLYAEGKVPFMDAPQYGFQLTFFRRADRGGEGIGQEYQAHGALTDIRNQRTFFASRVGGGALGVAGVAESTLMALSGDWSADLVAGNHLLRYSLPVDSEYGGPLLLRLVGASSSLEWLQGKNGFSRKGNCPSCASIYYSVPDLSLKASLIRRQGSELQQMHGLGWMDHEFMSQSLDQAQKGWDWMGLMLRDGRQLMIFRLRNEKGESDFISGTLRGSSGSIALSARDFSMTPLERWRSPKSGVEYPISWRVEVPAHGISTVIAARVASCEVGQHSSVGLPQYWEGPVAASDESVIGYLEMTGYSGKVSL
jgi:predicted secreted hydrolase